MNTLKNVLMSIWGWIKRTVLSNFWMKVFSLVLAVAMWCFVLTNDTTITRERTLTNMYVTTTNQSTLDSRQLAITEVLSDILPQVRVSIEVTQGDYYRVTSNNVRVELDLSRIRETGEQTYRSPPARYTAPLPAYTPIRSRSTWTSWQRATCRLRYS